MDRANLLCSPELCALRVGASAGDWMIAYLFYLVIDCLCWGFVWGVSVAHCHFDGWAYASIGMSSLMLCYNLSILWRALS